MEYVLDNAQMKEIVDDYGTSVKMIGRIINILNTLDLPIDEDVFMELVANIASIIETEQFQMEMKVERAGYSIREAVYKAVLDRFDDDEFLDSETKNKLTLIKTKTKFYNAKKNNL